MTVDTLPRLKWTGCHLIYYIHFKMVLRTVFLSGVTVVDTTIRSKVFQSEGLKIGYTSTNGGTTRL